MNLMLLCFYFSVAAYSAAFILFFLKKREISYRLIDAGFVLNLAFIIQRGWIAGLFILFPGFFILLIFMSWYFVQIRFKRDTESDPFEGETE